MREFEREKRKLKGDSYLPKMRGGSEPVHWTQSQNGEKDISACHCTVTWQVATPKGSTLDNTRRMRRQPKQHLNLIEAQMRRDHTIKSLLTLSPSVEIRIGRHLPSLGSSKQNHNNGFPCKTNGGKMT